MGNRSLGTSNRPTWATYSADLMLAFLCRDGSGDDLAEVNGNATTGDFTGTTTNLWDNATYGVTPPASTAGYWLSQASAFYPLCDFRNTGRWVYAADVHYTAANLTSSETVLSWGALTNSAGGSGTRGGFFRISLYDSGSNLGVRVFYRDGESLDSDNTQTNQTLQYSQVLTAGNGSANSRAHIAAEVINDGSAITVRTWINGSAQADQVPTITGARRAHLVPECGFVIGGRMTNGVSADGTERLGQGGSGAKLANLVIWYSESATATQTAALVEQLYKYRGARPAAL